MLYLRSCVFFTLAAVAVFPYAAGVVLLAPLPYRYRYRVARGWVDLFIWLLEHICGLRYEVHGAENIPAQPSVVYLRHSSAWETLAEVQIFPQQTWVLKRELNWIPIFGWALALLRPIAINRRARRTAVRQVIRQGQLRLEQGMWVMIFPEGTRMLPGETRRYGLSGALLATRTGRPLVPVVHNAEDFWPRKSFIRRSGTIRVEIGPPLETKGRTAEQINAEAKAWIEGRLREISVHHRPESG